MWSPAAALASLLALPGWDVAQANWLGRCAGKRAAGPGIHTATCYTPVKPHVKHMSNTWHTHAIHMEYTLFSVMLCHAWSFSVMDVIGHWGCNSPGDCKFIVLHFYMSPGVLPRAAKKQCSHHIPKITTVDIQPDGKYNFRKNSTVDKRQKSLRLILLSAEAARAAAAALPYADNRRRNLPVAAAARARHMVAPEPPGADSVTFLADRERSLPPRREPSRGPQGGLLVHPENPRYVWSFLEKMWVPREETDSTYRGARSRSPPPRQNRDPCDDPYRMTW